MIRGGPWLGAARRYLKAHVWDGDRVIWGSEDTLIMTARQIEELAEAAVVADREYREVVSSVEDLIPEAK